MPRRSSLLKLAASLACGTFVATGALADPVLRTVSFPGHWLGEHVALTSDSIVAVHATSQPIPGDPYGLCSTSGSDLMIIRDIDGGAPIRTRVPLPGFDATSVLRLTPTRILVSGQAGGAGGIRLVDDLGGANRVTSIDVSSIAWTGSELRPYTATRLADDAAILRGPRSSALLSDLGGANTVTPLVMAGDGVIVGVLDTMRFLMRRNGRALRIFDRSGEALTSTTIDTLDRFDTVVTPIDATRAVDLAASAGRFALLENLGTTPTLREVTLPSARYLGSLARLGTERILLTGSFVNGVSPKVYVVDALDTAKPIVAEFDAPIGGADLPLALGSDLAVLFQGYAGEDTPSSVLVLSDLGGAKRAEIIPLGVPLEIVGPPTALGDRQLAIPARGRLDDLARLVVVSDLGGENRAEVLPLGRFWAGVGQHWMQLVYGLGRGALLAGVWDEEHGSHFLYYSGLGEAEAAAPVVVPIEAHRELELLGNGLAIAQSDLPADDACTGKRDAVSGLPGGLVLRTSRVQLRFAGAETKLRVTAELRLPRPELFAGQELTVRLGPLAQVISAERIVPTRKGWLYRDPAGADGWVRRLEYAPTTGALRIDGRTPGFFLGELDPDNFAVSLESRDLYAAEYVAGALRSRTAARGAP